jgi:predicted ATP-dependent Lon-type protease
MPDRIDIQTLNQWQTSDTIAKGKTKKDVNKSLIFVATINNGVPEFDFLVVVDLSNTTASYGSAKDSRDQFKTLDAAVKHFNDL